ncbi:PfkB family carbohydrate kinase [Bradyrhizobium sp. AZCC 1693]|uniref:PfkB family carbohydrate kinase n=1 Tax=Bradyrhizobium sp. AZCC 1693 TaxID=3117029 RepID=UPI003FA5332A
MTDIVTITPSPAIDLSTAVDRISPVARLRGQSQRRDPGGGGINVARVIRRLGGDARAIYPVGGAIGKLLRQLLDQEGVASHTWTIAGETRENFFVDEISAGKQRGAKFVLDTSRPALAAETAEGVDLIKPNLREMRVQTPSASRSLPAPRLCAVPGRNCAGRPTLPVLPIR